MFFKKRQNSSEEDLFELRQKYQGMHRVEQTDQGLAVEGEFRFSASLCGKKIEDTYLLRILRGTDYPSHVPRVWEIGGRIPETHHKLHDGSFCLGAPLEVRRKYAISPTLLGFVENLVIPYLYAHSHLEEYGTMPFGELSHAHQGIAEYYLELFGLENHVGVLGLLRILADNCYRGHQACPCESGKHLRTCHGPLLLEIQAYQSPKQFMFDYGSVLLNMPKNSKPLPTVAKSTSFGEYLRKESAVNVRSEL